MGGRGVLILSVLLATAPAVADDLPPMVKDAVQLELDGRTDEALDRYRAALSSEPVLVQDEAMALPLTVRVVVKAAHLSIDLGYGDEAWDLGGRLLAAKGRLAVEAGTLVRMRLLRLEGKPAEAFALFRNYQKTWPGPLGVAIATEARRLREILGKEANQGPPVDQTEGPAPWVASGNWGWLPGPTEALGIEVAATARLQVGAFKDWANALTLVGMLREKGWSPLMDSKPATAGDSWHVVYIITRQLAMDRARLKAQGLLP